MYKKQITLKVEFLQYFWSVCILSFSVSISAQTCSEYTPPSTPKNHFIINQNNTVTDIETGLTWKRCLEGATGKQCKQGQVIKLTLEQAVKYVANQPKWRLPNIKEITSIAEFKCIQPAINLTIFPLSSSFDSRLNNIIISATPYWGMNIYAGYHEKINYLAPNFVLLVRNE